ncbi:hypothetical protein [Actinocorallia populi]|uniref:hypothetical protein n=1 Tax=Actinocorallia populi TaxID=2079200 RepID=UPI000D091EAE|nr:hypothetical protein [Actinocorallia populi]
MLQAFCFGTLGVTLEDLYFIDPTPAPGQDGPERGVRVELRLLPPQEWRGSIYAAQRFVLDEALWRADFFESIARGPGSKDRMHHHPEMDAGEPGSRVFDRSLTQDPFAWLEKRLTGLPETCRTPEHEASAKELLANVPHIVEAARTMLSRVHAGELALAPTRPTSL